MPLLFVYGSLKQGFPNFHINRGRRLPGDFRTVQPHPLHLIHGELPCLLPLPGQGLAVKGQVFDVGAEELAAMDRLERLGEPGGYHRIEIAVQPVADPQAPPFTAMAYVQDPALLQQPGEHPGPLAEYTHEHAQRLRWRGP